MEFSRQQYRSGLPFPSPMDLPDPGIELGSPALQADSSLTELPGKPVIDIQKQKMFKDVQDTIDGNNPGANQW